MTIERHKSRLYGIIENDPVVLTPGTTELLEKSWPSGTGKQIYVQDHDTLIISDLLGIIPDVSLHKTQINEYGVQSIPLKPVEMVTGTVRRYVWTPGIPVEAPVKEAKLKRAARLQLRRA